MSKKRKIRVRFARNAQVRRQREDLTRAFRQSDHDPEVESKENVRAKGDLSRRRTVQVDDSGELAVDAKGAIRGRVLIPHGLYCVVAASDGRSYKCYTRRLLKSLDRDSRNILATGDWVWFRPAPGEEGFILRIEPRNTVLTRAYRQREQIIAANVDQVLIVCALAEPPLRRNLIDRYLVSAGRGGLDPVICLNKADLAESETVQPIVGLYTQLGYPVVLTSARSGQGIDQLRDLLTHKETVIVGQSGVGKSSLLNALEPRYHLKVGHVNQASLKGRHTTTSAQLLALEGGGSVIDTPGVRQFDVWKVESGDVEKYFREFHAFTAHCRYPGCLHLGEEECAVRSATADRMISYGRYDSYVRLCRPEPNLSQEEA